MSKDKKPLPSMNRDEDAERFVSEADLSGICPFRLQAAEQFCFRQEKDARLEMRIAQTELDALREEAEKRGMPPHG